MGKSKSTSEKDVVKAAKAGKTKAKASSSDQSKEEIVLHALLKEYKFGRTKGIKNEELAKKCCTNKTSQWFLDTLKILRDQKQFVEKGPEGLVLTEAGAAFLGYQQADLSKLATNEELHEHIKESLDPKFKGAQIFDLFVKHGAKTRKELAELMGCNDRSHGFSYGLQELKVAGWVGPVGDAHGQGSGNKKLLDLTEKAWVTPPTTDGE